MSPVRPTLLVVGQRHEPEHHRLRDFLTRIAQPFEWAEAGSERARQILADRGLADVELPLVVDGDDDVEAATVERLVAKWRVADGPTRKDYDLSLIHI